MLCLVAQPCPTLWDPMNGSPQGSSVRVDSPGKNTGVGCHTLLQGIFPTQRSNPGFSSCRWILYHLSHENIGVGDYPMDMFAILCSRGASPPRNRTEIFKTAGRFLTSWATREALTVGWTISMFSCLLSWTVHQTDATATVSFFSCAPIKKMSHSAKSGCFSVPDWWFISMQYAIVESHWSRYYT